MKRILIISFVAALFAAAACTGGTNAPNPSATNAGQPGVSATSTPPADQDTTNPSYGTGSTSDSTTTSGAE